MAIVAKFPAAKYYRCFKLNITGIFADQCGPVARLFNTMKVIDHITNAKDTLVSFEILPPLKGKTISSIYEHLDPRMELGPGLSSTSTYHRSETMFKKKSDGNLFEKVEYPQTPRHRRHLRRDHEPL